MSPRLSLVFTGLSGTSQTLALLGSDPGDGFNSTSLQGFQIVNTAPVPEPGTWALLGSGAAFLGLTLRRLRRRAVLRA